MAVYAASTENWPVAASPQSSRNLLLRPVAVWAATAQRWPMAMYAGEPTSPTLSCATLSQNGCREDLKKKAITIGRHRGTRPR